MFVLGARFQLFFHRSYGKVLELVICMSRCISNKLFSRLYICLLCGKVARIPSRYGANELYRKTDLRSSHQREEMKLARKATVKEIRLPRARECIDVGSNLNYIYTHTVVQT